MKKQHLILACSLIFTLLFYNQELGVNLAIFGVVLTVMICYFFQERFTTRLHLVLVITSVLSCFAFAWYGDFVSFVSLFLSLIFLQFKTQDSKLKIIQSIPLVFINGLASIVRIFHFSQWLPESKIENQRLKKLIAYFIIPAFFITVFFIVYSFGSNHFSGLFSNLFVDMNVFEVFLIALLGFYISFSFWNYWVPDVCYLYNSKLDDDFSNEIKTQNQKTFSFLDLDFERKSGEITLVLLNCMLLIFIGTYNYEQFVEVQVGSSLSEATHERVNAVIFSIVMAVGVILFYFKGGFNFDTKAKNLKQLAKIWILLNGVLIISTVFKNSEYVASFGLTYKRLGVYAFLILAIIGLFFTFLKIRNQKTNAYLFNQMVWCFYGTLLLCSFVNWGNLITNYNLAVGKGTELLFLEKIDFNDKTFYEVYGEEIIKSKRFDHKKDEILKHQSQSFLSKALYYETLEKK